MNVNLCWEQTVTCPVHAASDLHVTIRRTGWLLVVSHFLLNKKLVCSLSIRHKRWAIWVHIDLTLHMIREINCVKAILNYSFWRRTDWLILNVLHCCTWANSNSENEWLWVISSRLWYERGFILNSRSFRGNTVNASSLASNNHSRCSKVRETIKGL